MKEGFMRKASLFLCLLTVLLFYSCQGKTLMMERSKANQNLDAQKAYDLIKENANNPDFEIIDVRTSEEFADAHIPQAININIGSPDFKSILEKKDKNKTYLLYCRTANRSKQALDMMNQMQFREAYHIFGGIREWEINELPIEK
jgi:rhodanese-related sulfurtransferase